MSHYFETDFADYECDICDGTGRIYNNADVTCGQWVECECVDFNKKGENDE